MTKNPLHLVERAAERLLRSGSLDPSAEQLLTGNTARAEAGSASDGVPAPTGPGDTVVLVQEHSQSEIGPLEGMPSRQTSSAAAAAPGSEAEASADLGPGRYAPAASLARPPVIPIAALSAAGMVDWRRMRSRESEEFRLIQAQLLRSSFGADAPADSNPNVVMITSARPGEGKSFTSLNIAAGIARQRDRDVLLVDLDYKPGALGEIIGLRGAPGLLDLLIDPGLEPSDVIVPTELDKLFILPIGRPTERSPELFSTRQMTRLIGDIGRQFADWIIILDTAPVLSTSDPSTFAPVVGQIIMVVEAERTQRQEIESALDLISTSSNITLLLNKVQVAPKHAFGGYSSYYGPYSSYYSAD